MGRHKKAVELVFNPVFEPLFYDNIDDPRYYQVFGGRGCFSPEQKIVVDGGKTVSIKDVKVGDLVKSYNLSTKEIETKEVTHKFKYENDELLEVKMKSGYVIRCTRDHKFLFNGEWKTMLEILELKYGKEYPDLINMNAQTKEE